MRALHFCFLLHHPYDLRPAEKWERGYFGGEESFQKKNHECYQPLLALLERNFQRYPDLKISLAISGLWLEQAERWDADLIKRIRRMVQSGNVDLVTLPYSYAMAAFFEMDELAAQVKRTREKYEQLFDYKSRSLSMPECCYHNKIAQWAEKNDFKVILAGKAEKSLGWRNPNKVYLARGCEDVRVLFQDAKLTEMLVKADEKATLEVTETVEIDLPEADLDSVVRSMRQGGVETRRKKVFDAKVFQKQLDLELLRGDLINIYLSSTIMEWRDKGVIGFFDELFKIWEETPGRKLVNAKGCEELPAQAEISVKMTASSLGEAKREYALPDYWKNMEIDRQHRLYDLREKVLETHDKDMYVDFMKLTARDYAGGGAEFDAIFEDIRKKAARFSHDKMVDDQPSKKGMNASTKVKINFDATAREARRRKEELLQLFREVNAGDELDQATWNGIEMDDMEAAIQVLAQRMQKNPDNHHAYDNLAEAEVIQDDIWMEQEVVLSEDDVEEVTDEDLVDMDGMSEAMDVEMEMDDDAESVEDAEKVEAEEITEDKKVRKKKKIVID